MRALSTLPGEETITWPPVVVLVDSSIWIDLLREAKTAQTLALRQLLPAGEAALTPVIYREILQGAASSERFTRLKRYFRTLPFLNPSDVNYAALRTRGGGQSEQVLMVHYVG